MPIPDADPRAKDLDQQFAAAMTGPQKPRSEPKAPKEIDPDAPFGRDDAGEPIAKYGRTAEGKIKRSAGGRPSKKDPDHARVADALAGSSPGEPKDGKVVSPKDYTADISEAADGLWLLMTGASRLPLGRLRVGKIGLPKNAGDRLGAQAAVLSMHKHRLAVALNEAAQHNARARRLAEACAGGDVSWVITVGALALPFAFQSLEVWKADGQPGSADVAGLARQNRAQMAEFMQQMMDGARAIQAEADAHAAAA